MHSRARGSEDATPEGEGPVVDPSADADPVSDPDIERAERARPSVAVDEVRSAALTLRGFVGAVPTATLVVGADGRILLANGEAERTFRAAAGELDGLEIEALVPTEARRRHRVSRQGFGPGRRPMAGRRLEAVRLDGVPFPAEVGLGSVTIEGRPLVVVAVSDLAERERAETVLRKSEERYRHLFEHNPQPMWVYDPETLRFLDVNDAAVSIYGYDRAEFLAMTILDIRPAEEIPATLEAVARPGEGYRGTMPSRHRRRDGTVFDVEISTHAFEVEGGLARLVSVADVTERRRLEEQLRQSQKMEAVGRLAGGVAHDFNNLLTAINGYAELIRTQLADDDPLAADVDEIRRAGERAAGLTRQLLAFGRRQVLAAQVFDLDELVANLEAMLRRVIGEDIEFATVLGAGQALVRGDPSQIENVVVNLVVNARDAMPGGGRLTIETRRVELDGAYAVDHLGTEPGPYVMLAVTDTGHGMAPDVLSHVFEPFFTTKPAGRGTGLGLSTVYGIVTQTGGQVWVYSEPGLGSTFKVYLPAAAGEVRTFRRLETTLGVPGGSETVLVVEDEAAVLSLAETVLRRQGYRVLIARDAASGARLAEGEPGGIDLLVTDVVMPGEGGPELASRLQRRWPELPVIFMSGYAEEAVVRHGMLDGAAAFLSKPFDPAVLARRVRDVLDGGKMQ